MYATDGQTGRQMDRQTDKGTDKSNAHCPSFTVGGVISVAYFPRLRLSPGDPTNNDISDDTE